MALIKVNENHDINTNRIDYVEWKFAAEPNTLMHAYIYFGKNYYVHLRAEYAQKFWEEYTYEGRRFAVSEVGEVDNKK